MFKVNNKNNRDVVLVFLFFTLNIILHLFCSVSIANFEQVNVGCVITLNTGNFNRGTHEQKLIVETQ